MSRMNWSSRTLAVYTAMLTLTTDLGRPPTRAELAAALPEWADTSAVGRVLRRLVDGGLVDEVTPGDFVLTRTRSGEAITYLVEVGP